MQSDYTTSPQSRKPYPRNRESAQPNTHSTCLYCGRVFEHIASRQAKFCSQTCFGTAYAGPRGKRQQRVCLCCGHQFPVSPSSKQRYCSRPCTDMSKKRQPTEQRFWAMVEKTAGCWLWTGSLNIKGYGVFTLATPTWHNIGAHRYSYELHYGPLVDSQRALHSCDVLYAVNDITYRRCVRPDHLFAGTDADNTADMMSKGRGRWDNACKGERHGMACLTENDVMDIRQRYANGEKPQEIRRDYPISYTHFKSIVNGRSWKHVPLS